MSARAILVDPVPSASTSLEASCANVHLAPAETPTPAAATWTSANLTRAVPMPGVSTKLDLSDANVLKDSGETRPCGA